LSVADGLGGLERYGVVILPALMVAEQFGVPLPAVPALLAVGALGAQGRANLALEVVDAPALRRRQHVLHAEPALARIASTCAVASGSRADQRLASWS